MTTKIEDRWLNDLHLNPFEETNLEVAEVVA
jgi:hypothetical protein